MRKIFVIVSLLVVFLLSCSKTKEVRVVESVYPGGKEKLVCFYLDKNGQKVQTRQLQFYENGNKMFEGTLKNDKKEGKWTYWYENGNLWSEGSFKDGEPEGERTVYHENGKKYYTGKFSKGKPVGKWVFYNIEGQKSNEIDYK